MEPLIELQNITKKFTEPVEFRALDDISLTINKGEFVCITGPSGSGKSTLLYILSTLDSVYEGDYYCAGTKMNGLTQNQLADFRNENIGFVFQFHYLLPEFTVLENVMIPAIRRNVEPKEIIRKNALEILDLLGVADQAEKSANKLSGGQQQRVAIARALINKPKIIMGDEPTGNLDSVNSKNVLQILKNLRTTIGQTVIIVTHDEHFALASDRQIKIKDGKIEQS
jgi:lipoprotein-releasing system ATP-binding protein